MWIPLVLVSRLKRVCAAFAGRDSVPAPSAQTSARGETNTRLVHALVACLDRLDPDEDAAAQASDALASSGVSRIDPVGEPFDRTYHRAQGRVDTDDPGRDWTVAGTVIAGWTREEAVLRPAEVWVYRLAQDASRS